MEDIVNRAVVRFFQTGGEKHGFEINSIVDYAGIDITWRNDGIYLSVCPDCIDITVVNGLKDDAWTHNTDYDRPITSNDVFEAIQLAWEKRLPEKVNNVAD